MKASCDCCMVVESNGGFEKGCNFAVNNQTFACVAYNPLLKSCLEKIQFLEVV